MTLNGERSTEKEVLSGVPQGSVLGPCLFALFVNDMPNCVKSLIRLFADDAKLYRTIKDRQDCETLQEDLNSLLSWATTWQLNFNVNKCYILRIGTNLPDFIYHMSDSSGNRHNLKEVPNMKDLGVTISNDLNFEVHVNNVTNSANRALYTVKRTMKHLNAACGPTLYKSLVRPILEYGNSAWCPSTARQREALEKIQRRATRWICPKNMVYERRLRFLKLPSLSHRRRRGDLIEVFKYFRNEKVYNSLKFTINKAGRTRGHSLKITKHRWRLNVRGRAFANRVINDWNSLPSGVVEAKSLDSFKARLDRHWENTESVFRVD